jgi:ATP-dependent Lon protease
MGQCDGFDPQSWVPIFPLPNCVLLPGGVVPLHIYEPRFSKMMGDALADRRLIAMALLKPGWQEKYHTHHAVIHSVVCVGAVLSHEELTDGCYNLLLQGRFRARVRQEDHAEPYRRAHLEVIHSRLPEAHVAAAECLRGKLHKLLTSKPFDQIRSVRHLVGLFEQDIPIENLCDLVAHALVPASELDVRQRFLETVDVVSRMEHLVDEVGTLGQVINTARRRCTPGEPGISN